MILADWRRNTSTSLIEVTEDASSALIETDVLLCHVLSQSRSWLYAHSDEHLDPSAVGTLDAVRDRRLAGEPLAYITSDCEFRSRTYRVTPAVLIPRDDTDVLVETALNEINQRLATEDHCHVLDAGTGSGIVAISLYLEAPARAPSHSGLRILASDIDNAALYIARENARSLGASVEFVQGHWLNAIATHSLDIVVSNPPYIAANDSHLQALQDEPQRALVSGVDGLDAIRELAIDARRVLRDQGVLLLEHGYDQREAISELLADAGYVDIHCHKDLAGEDRVTSARLPDTAA